MPAGSLSAPPLMTPGPMIRAMSLALRCSRATSRAVGCLAAARRRVTSDTRRHLGRDRQRPVAARLFLEQSADGERCGLIDAHQHDRLTAVDAPLNVLDVLRGHDTAQPLSVGPVDDFLARRDDPAVFAHEFARQLCSRAVAERGDDGLLQQPGSLEPGSDDEVRDVDLAHALSDPRTSLANQLLAVLPALERAPELEAVPVQPDFDVLAKGRMRLVGLARQHRFPPG